MSIFHQRPLLIIRQLNLTPLAVSKLVIRGCNDSISKDITAELFDWKLTKFDKN
jgi:hypothetical protein